MFLLYSRRFCLLRLDLNFIYERQQSTFTKQRYTGHFISTVINITTIQAALWRSIRLLTRIARQVKLITRPKVKKWRHVVFWEGLERLQAKSQTCMSRLAKDHDVHSSKIKRAILEDLKIFSRAQEEKHVLEENKKVYRSNKDAHTLFHKKSVRLPIILSGRRNIHH